VRLPPMRATLALAVLSLSACGGSSSTGSSAIGSLPLVVKPEEGCPKAVGRVTPTIIECTPPPPPPGSYDLSLVWQAGNDPIIGYDWNDDDGFAQKWMPKYYLVKLKRDQQCAGAMPINSPLVNDTHDGSVSNVFILEAVNSSTGVIQQIGWEYQTYGGTEYFQPNASFSVGVSGGVAFVSISASAGTGTAPYLPFNSNGYTLMQELAGALSTEFGRTVNPSMLPGIFGQITGQYPLRQLECYSGTG
jgi:hypothetical protein